MAIPTSRDEQIANFYREHAARLHRGICGKTVGLDNATVQDACATAWERRTSLPVRGARELAGGHVAVSAGQQFGPTTSDRLTVLVPG